MKLLIVCLAMSMSSAMAQIIFTGGGDRFSRSGRMQQPMQQSMQQPTGNGSISGNVQNEVTHEPAKKVQVSLNGSVNLTAATDDAGHFAFKQLPPGTYALNASGPNISPPRPRMGPSARPNITLAADEQKSGVSLSVIPAAAISGRLTDEEGAPLSNCNVTTMQFDYNQGPKTLSSRNGANSNEKGEYRITNLMAGSYFLFARCHQTIPLPHAFIRRNSGMEAPTMSYAPQFYPGTLDFNAATKLTATGGSELSGMDFRLSPGGTVSVRGKVGSLDPESLKGNVQVRLEPRDPLRRGWVNMPGRMNRQSGEFRIDSVTPGSYDIVANTFGEGNIYYAKVPIEVGSNQPEPIDVMLAPAVTLTGTVAVEGEMKVPLETMRVQLVPTDGNRFLGGPPPNSPVQKDSTFTLKGVIPGRWAIFVHGPPGYVKSVTVNNRETASQFVDIPAGGGGQMKVVLSSIFAKVDGTVSGIQSNSGQVSGLIWRVQEHMDQMSIGQIFTASPEGRFSIGNLAPGQHVACALATAEPWMLMQNGAVKNALKSKCETIEVSAQGNNNLQLRLIPAQDLETIVASVEN
jgi:hypothetical protein